LPGKERVIVASGYLKPWVAALNVLLAAEVALAADVAGGLPLRKDVAGCVRRTYGYEMRGMVRLLFFWVGRSNVGGGKVALLDDCTSPAGEMVNGVELLFGSFPERVPGGHNRWGFARETAFWNRVEPGDHPLRTEFEGFMTLSQEEDLDEVRKSSAQEENGRFEATLSRVEGELASAELRRFGAPPTVTFLEPEPTIRAYLARLEEPPDSEKRLALEPGEPPWGFLTALRRLVEDAVEVSTAGGSLESLERRSLRYFYNGRRYTLVLKKAKLKSEFRLDSGLEFRDALGLDFETTNHASGKRHGFFLAVGTREPYRGVPLRIEDKPRWWLRVRLDLKPDAQPEAESVQESEPA